MKYEFQALDGKTQYVVNDKFIGVIGMTRGEAEYLVFMSLGDEMDTSIRRISTQQFLNILEALGLIKFEEEKEEEIWINDGQGNIFRVKRSMFETAMMNAGYKIVKA